VSCSKQGKGRVLTSPPTRGQFPAPSCERFKKNGFLISFVYICLIIAPAYCLGTSMHTCLRHSCLFLSSIRINRASNQPETNLEKPAFWMSSLVNLVWLQSLCNACGIRYRKKRRQELGLDGAKKPQQNQRPPPPQQQQHQEDHCPATSAVAVRDNTKSSRLQVVKKRRVLMGVLIQIHAATWLGTRHITQKKASSCTYIYRTHKHKQATQGFQAMLLVEKSMYLTLLCRVVFGPESEVDDLRGQCLPPHKVVRVRCCR
jgi:hypothetical protein